ncbi:glycoside hydrolase family 43 protein [Sphingobium sp. CR2-8]|uniref:glycoside hydrolase family 43 protein n=1 Tax=Sphingobium sp. CR2-8 TaxID=1306534 RepID=UPI002DB70E51|nr:glycoside hydrolase family 43 protein [Sphingobium sp. CR2-8]MEC3912741.1 glycoside hydrolase family 43 protein [Sphingobium sp. CR2-8]
MMRRRDFVLGLGALTLAACTTGQTGQSDDVLVFAYFTTGKAGEADGLKLAVSEDGFAFRTLAGGRSVLVPSVGEKALLRDPFLFHDGQVYHLLWTTAWEGVTIGHATSADLIHWSAQQAIPVMRDVPGTRNCWAPEAIRDPRTGRYVIVWSSTVEGRFTETAGASESGYNHRLWRCETADFKHFSKAEPLYDPGFSVIDGSFADGPDGGLYLIVKDETVAPPRKWLQVAKADSPTGPFGPLSPSFSPAWVEGPMTTRIGDALICYYDVYKEGRWGAAMTRDMAAWQDVSDRLTMPAGARHGSLLRVPRALVDAIG